MRSELAVWSHLLWKWTERQARRHAGGFIVSKSCSAPLNLQTSLAKCATRAEECCVRCEILAPYTKSLRGRKSAGTIVP